MDYFKVGLSYVSPIHYSLILARDERGGIGLANSLPWKGIVDNKDDMAWFRQHTAGKIIIMGYNTWVSIGRKPLPGRINIVITEKHSAEVTVDVERVMSAFYDTKEPASKAPVIKICKSPSLVKEFLSTNLGSFHKGGEVMVIGGAKIYEAFMEWTSRIYLTTFEGQFAADTFVDLNLDKWRLVYRDALSTLKPVFEVWDTTTEAVAMLDSDIIKISYGLKPAEGFVAEYVLPGVPDAV